MPKPKGSSRSIAAVGSAKLNVSNGSGPGVELHGPTGRCTSLTGHSKVEIGGLEPANSRRSPSHLNFREAAVDEATGARYPRAAAGYPVNLPQRPPRLMAVGASHARDPCSLTLAKVPDPGIRGPAATLDHRSLPVGPGRLGRATLIPTTEH